MPWAAPSLPPPPRWATRRCGRRRAIRSLLWCVGRRARTYCRPCSRFSASPAGHATLLPWACAAAAYTAPCTWPGHAGGGGGCSASKAAYVLERSCSTGRGCRIKRGGVPRLVVLVLAPRGAACWPKVPGGVKERARARVGASEHGWMRGAMCMPRGGGRLSKTVAMSLAREDHTTTPRWRARAQIVLFSRGWLVSRIGQKNQKSTTCEPSTLRRGAWSRPTRGLRSARTSLPRRARTAHWKGAG